MEEGLNLIQDLALALLIAGIAGWIARKAGLSAVVGYLLAGLIAGPHTPPFALISESRINTLSQVGVVFLMFSVGMGLSLQRLKRLGLPLIFGTMVTAFLVFQGSRLLAVALGWSELRGMFFAGMFMVSSSAIISKVLSETGESHEKYGQRALGITVLEDLVAVFMLTLLTSRVSAVASDPSAAALGKTVWLMLGFVVVLMVAGLLVLPRLFRVLNQQGAADLVILLVAGFLFGAAILASHAGYSVALGAFLFGIVVAETASRETVERSFTGAREMFSAVFFVSIGMLIDPSSMLTMWWQIILLSGFVIALRFAACGAGLTLTGAPLRDALKSGLTVIPIGEFSYLMAQKGVESKVLPDTAYSLAVGISLVTAVVVPALVRHSDPIAGGIEKRLPRFVQKALEAYQNWLDRLSLLQRQNIIWRHTQRRIAFALLELLAVGGVVGFASPLNRWVAVELTSLHLDCPGWEVVYWVLVLVLLAFPFAGLWRSLEVLAVLLADVSTHGMVMSERLRAVLEKVFRAVIIVLLLALLLPLVPVGIAKPGVALATLSICALIALVLWGRLTKWYSYVRNKFEGAFSGVHAPAARFKTVFRYRDNWNADLLECALPDNAACSGKKLIEVALRSRFGCSVVQLERQGVLVSNPPADMTLFPGDKLLLFGSPVQVSTAQRFLHLVHGVNDKGSTFDESELGTVVVPEHSPKAGRTLANLEVFRSSGIQILAVDRNGAVTLNPSANEVIQAGDSLLVLGTADQIRDFFGWLDME